MSFPSTPAHTSAELCLAVCREKSSKTEDVFIDYLLPARLLLAARPVDHTEHNNTSTTGSMSHSHRQTLMARQGQSLLIKSLVVNIYIQTM